MTAGIWLMVLSNKWRNANMELCNIVGYIVSVHFNNPQWALIEKHLLHSVVFLQANPSAFHIVPAYIILYCIILCSFPFLIEEAHPVYLPQSSSKPHIINYQKKLFVQKYKWSLEKQSHDTHETMATFFFPLGQICQSKTHNVFRHMSTLTHPPCDNRPFSITNHNRCTALT